MKDSFNVSTGPADVVVGEARRTSVADENAALRERLRALEAWQDDVRLLVEQNSGWFECHENAGTLWCVHCGSAWPCMGATVREAARRGEG